jgi:hypothetical protein
VLTSSPSPTIAGFFLWNQWYMILVYCVVGVVILVMVVLAVWFGCSVKFNYCVRAKKVVRKRERVHRSERRLVYKRDIRGKGQTKVCAMDRPL